MPPQPGEELKVRVQEAQDVERLSRQAAATLRADLKKGESREIIQTDFDRLAMLALELQRRVLAARDVAAQTETGARLATELERLEHRHTAWLQFVEANRHADVATQVEQLEDVLLERDEG